MTEHSSPKLTVAIIGGGIGGLTLAVALQQSSTDIHIDIYEAAARFTEIGAGVGLWRRPWQALRRIGLYDELHALTSASSDEDAPRLAFEFRKSDQADGFKFFDLMVPMGNLPFHRADFQGALVSKLSPRAVTPHFGKRLVSYWQNTNADSAIGEKVALYFKDGSSATCDVLLAADGIRSVVREQLLREAAAAVAVRDAQYSQHLLDLVTPRWSGSVAYRGVIPSQRLIAIAPNHGTLRFPQNYIGKDKHVIAFPIVHNDALFVNVVAFCSFPDQEGIIHEGGIVHDCSQEEALSQFDGWEAEVVQLLQCIDNPSKWSINALNGLPISTHGRVALVGDAAHAMTPHQGSGAGQAIEDAYILAKILAHPKTTLRTASEVLKVYEQVRLPHANGVQRRSRENGKLYEIADPRFVDLARYIPPEGAAADRERLRELADTAIDNWSWAWTTDVDDDLLEALKQLDQGHLQGHL